MSGTLVLLFHSPNDLSSRGWTLLKPGAMNSVLVSHFQASISGPSHAGILDALAGGWNRSRAAAIEPLNV